METKTNSLAEMDKMPVGKAIRKNVIPAACIMLMSLIYNMADKVFIGMSGNDYMVAAVTLAMPVFILFTSFGNIFGTGGVALISQSSGEGNTKKSRKVSSFCFWGSIAVGVVLMLILIIFRSPIVGILGAKGSETIKYTIDYLTIVAIGCPFTIVAQTVSSLIRADGKPTLSMIGMILGNALNIVLDPIFILGFGMGTKGAALATLLGQAAATMFYLICILKKKCNINISIADVTVKDGIAKSVFVIGIPAALGSIFQSVCNILMNGQMAKYSDYAVAGIGAAQNIITIISIMAVGIGMGIQPLVGYQVGMKNKKKFNEILRYSIVMTTIICLCLTLLCYLFTNPIIGAFVSGTEALNYGTTFARIVMSTAWLYALFTVLSLVLQGMGESTTSLIVTMSRNCYVFIPILYLLSGVFGMYGIVWALPVSDVICVIITVFVVAHAVKKIFKSEEK